MHTHPAIDTHRPAARAADAGAPGTRATTANAGSSDFADLLKAAEGAPAGTAESQNPTSARTAPGHAVGR